MLCHDRVLADAIKQILWKALRDPDSCHTGRDEKPVYLLSKWIDDAIMTKVSNIFDDKYNLDLSKITKSAPQPASTETPVMETSPPAMNDTMRQAVDLMLQNTKHGSMANIEHVIEMQSDKITELEKMLANAKSVPTMQPVSIKATGEIPSGNVVVKKALMC